MKKFIKITFILIALPMLLNAKSFSEMEGGEIYMSFLVVLGITVLFFVLTRQLYLWYFKINTMIENQNKTNTLLEGILKEQKKLNRKDEPAIESVSIKK